MSSGKWYAEFNTDIVSGGSSGVGVAGASAGIVNDTYPGDSTSNKGWMFSFYNGGSSKRSDGNATSFGSIPSNGNTIMCAVDMDNGNVWWGLNGTWFASGAPSSGANPVYSNLAGNIVCFFVGVSGGGTKITANLGQGGLAGLTYDAASGGRFKYTPPAGFKALSTANLSAPTIKNGSSFFNSSTWTGTGSASLTISSLGFQPDLVWIKNRSTAISHQLYDSVRGAGASMGLSSDNANSESADNDNSTYGYLSAFNSNGFTGACGSNGTTSYTNANGQNYVAWCWRKGATPGFDIQACTLTSASQSFNHSLGVKPAMILYKERSTTGAWIVAHQAIGATMNDYYAVLNSTVASTSRANAFGGEPTSNLFYASTVMLNAVGDNFIAYLWAEVPGFSRFGSYKGNGSADGPFVYCGFKPRYVMIKRVDAASISTSGAWMIVDAARYPANGVAAGMPELMASSSNAEVNFSYGSGGGAIDVVSNGFKCRGDYQDQNVTGGTYIFAAFAEAPFKYSTAR
jgi:hypothetical protein